MVPYNDQDLFEQPVYDPECKTIMFGWQMIKGKKGAYEEEKGFNKEEEEELIEILKGAQEAILEISKGLTGVQVMMAILMKEQVKGKIEKGSRSRSTK